MPRDADTVQFNIRGIELVYDVKEEQLNIDGVDAHLPMMDNKLNLTVYVDRTGLEVFANNGLFFMPINEYKQRKQGCGFIGERRRFKISQD